MVLDFLQLFCSSANIRRNYNIVMKYNIMHIDLEGK